MPHQKILFSSLLLFLLLRLYNATDTITPTRPIKDGEVLVSNGENFALGFFSPSNNSTNRFVGIWYNKVSEQTVVWVANRENPITNSSSGVLSVDQTGNLVLRDGDRRIPIWLTNVSAARADDIYSAQLLDSGNLVLFHDESKQVIAWQSFDYPTDTILPGMKYGRNRRTGLNWAITSWKSDVDPGTGEYSFQIELVGSPQGFFSKGMTRIWRTGSWNGYRWTGIPYTKSHMFFNVTYVDNSDEIFFMYTLSNTSIFTRIVVNETGKLERSTWIEGERRWDVFFSAPRDQCDSYSHCGTFGLCDPYEAEFECKCLPGFEPYSVRDWYLRYGKRGCIRKRGALTCQNGEGFVQLASVKIPDTLTAHVNRSLEWKACEELCLNNCSCTGYASANVEIGGRSGCITWYGNMIDTRKFSDGGQDLYIRVDATELAQYSKTSKRFPAKGIVGIVVPSAAVAVFLVLAFVCYTRKKRVNRKRNERYLEFTTSPASFQHSSNTGKEMKESTTNSGLCLFDLSTIVVATKNFSPANKLGEGGFGSVYKGTLHNGQELAIKRLSNSSGQGMEEFKNEVTLIAKLQHRNLVRLLGCCIQKEEKMLVYEYLPNKGLDSFIFDEEKCVLLDWKTRLEIILGIVRGLLYLHQDSRLKIIHRDLKASNVLLDASLNPKISDFGMAKIFRGDQIEAITHRVVGTYGYMSPEYAMEGLFSIKSDVFSFGVLLLEIISGRKNNSYYFKNCVNLIGHVWDQWRRDEALKIVDLSMGESYESREVLRCIHVGLLCVQELASERPNMSEVAFMLCNETTLPSPKQPAFVFRKPNGKIISTNDETITVVEAR